MSETVQAEINFGRRASEPVLPGELAVPGFPDNRLAPLRCAIADARKAEGLSLDRQGFALVPHSSACSGEGVAGSGQGYRQEMTAFLQDYLDAPLVVPSQIGLCVRYADRLVQGPRDEADPGYVDDTAPANFAHVDYLEPAQVAAHAALDAEAQGFDVSVYSRMVMVQTWRALSPPPQDMPLALCDRQTMRGEDIIRIKGVLPPVNNHQHEDQVYYVGSLHHSDRQRWYYYPGMTEDEVLLFVGMDTAMADGGQTAHTAFDNRANEPAAHTRKSLEARFYAYYD
jgi:hypothetical protein